MKENGLNGVVTRLRFFYQERAVRRGLICCILGQMTRDSSHMSGTFKQVTVLNIETRETRIGLCCDELGRLLDGKRWDCEHYPRCDKSGHENEMKLNEMK